MGNEVSGHQQEIDDDVACSSCHTTVRSQLSKGTWRRCGFEHCTVTMCGTCKKSFMFRVQRGQWRCAAHQLKSEHSKAENGSNSELTLNTREVDQPSNLSAKGQDRRSRVAKFERPVSDRHPAEKRENPPTPVDTPGNEIYNRSNLDMVKKHEPSNSPFPAFARQQSEQSLSHLSFSSIPSLGGMLSESASDDVMAALNLISPSNRDTGGLQTEHTSSAEPFRDQRSLGYQYHGSAHMPPPAPGDGYRHHQHAGVVMNVPKGNHVAMPIQQHHRKQLPADIQKMHRTSSAHEAPQSQIAAIPSNSQWNSEMVPEPMQMPAMPMYGSLPQNMTPNLNIQVPNFHSSAANVSRYNEARAATSNSVSINSAHQKSAASGNSFGQSEDSLEVLQHMINAKPSKETLRLGPLKEEPSGTGTKPRTWNEHEDRLLEKAVQQYGAKHWKTIATFVPNRNHVQCLQRWNKVLKPGLQKGGWTQTDDKLLIELVKKSKGEPNWSDIASKIRGRNSKQCRERYHFYLSPTIKKGPWTEEEDAILLKAQEELGNKWARIAKLIDGRTENAAKIRHKSLMRAMKRQWKQEEDDSLMELHAKFGKKWDEIAKHLPNRSKNAIKMRFKVLTQEQTTATNGTPAVSTTQSTQLNAKSIPKNTQGTRTSKSSVRHRAGTAEEGANAIGNDNRARSTWQQHENPTAVNTMRGSFSEITKQDATPSRMSRVTGYPAAVSHQVQQQRNVESNGVLQAMIEDLTTLDVDGDQSKSVVQIDESLNALQYLDQVVGNSNEQHNANSGTFSVLEQGLAMLSPTPLDDMNRPLEHRIPLHQPYAEAYQGRHPNPVQVPVVNHAMDYAQYHQKLSSTREKVHPVESSFEFSAGSLQDMNRGSFENLGTLNSLSGIDDQVLQSFGAPGDSTENL